MYAHVLKFIFSSLKAKDKKEELKNNKIIFDFWNGIDDPYVLYILKMSKVDYVPIH